MEINEQLILDMGGYLLGNGDYRFGPSDLCPPDEFRPSWEYYSPSLSTWFILEPDLKDLMDVLFADLNGTLHEE